MNPRPYEGEILGYDPNRADEFYLNEVQHAINQTGNWHLERMHKFTTANNNFSPETVGFVAILSPPVVESAYREASLLMVSALIDVAHKYATPVALVTDQKLASDLLDPKADSLLAATPRNPGQISWQIQAWLRTKVRHY